MKQKILKIKVGEVFIGGKVKPVFVTAFEKKSKKGETYYEARQQVFVHQIEKKEFTKEEKVEA